MGRHAEIGRDLVKNREKQSISEYQVEPDLNSVARSHLVCFQSVNRFNLIVSIVLSYETGSIMLAPLP